MNEDTTARIQALYQEIQAARAELVELLCEAAATPVDDVTFQGPDGAVRLSELFGDHDQLVLSFNMGTSCAYCTCWGDAINGYVGHLQRVAAFVCVSPDEPTTQQAFAAGRGWRFPMVSHGGSDWVVAMGLAEDRDGQRHYAPGFCVFQKTDDGIRRTAMEWYGPGDLYNGLFHMLSMLPDHGAGFQPSLELP